MDVLDLARLTSQLTQSHLAIEPQTEVTVVATQPVDPSDLPAPRPSDVSADPAASESDEPIVFPVDISPQSQYASPHLGLLAAAAIAKPSMQSVFKTKGLEAATTAVTEPFSTVATAGEEPPADFPPGSPADETPTMNWQKWWQMVLHTNNLASPAPVVPLPSEKEQSSKVSSRPVAIARALGDRPAMSSVTDPSDPSTTIPGDGGDRPEPSAASDSAAVSTEEDDILEDSLAAFVATTVNQRFKPITATIQAQAQLPTVYVVDPSASAASTVAGLKRGAPAACPGLSEQTLVPKNAHQIWLKEQFLLAVPQPELAAEMAATLGELLTAGGGGLDPDTIRLTEREGLLIGKIGDRDWFVLTPDVAAAIDADPIVLALHWVNQLREVWQGEPLSLTTTQMELWGLSQTSRQLEGEASWYGPYFHGRITATGELFDQMALTAAHPSLPFDTHLKVTNLLNGKSVVVRINDRGPYVGERSLDLSLGAARCLGSETVGVIPYQAVILR